MFIDEAGKAALKVDSVDILIAENGKDHHTFDYEMMERPVGANLVIRRGQPFNLGLKFNRNFDPATDAVFLIFTVAGTQHDAGAISWQFLHATYLLYPLFKFSLFL
jgi:hypothetical protein